MKRLLFILFYFQLASLAAQAKPGLNGKFIAFPEKNGFRFIDKDFSYFSADANQYETTTHGFNLDNLRLTYLYYSDKIRFLSAGGGTVYEYKNDSLYRIDKSFEFQSRFSSYNFVRGDSIISVGGSGEFNVQNNIIYFTDISLEWLVETRYDYRESDNRIPIGQYDVASNKVYFNLDQPSDVIEDKSIREVQNVYPTPIYSYDFDTKVFKDEYDLSSLFESFFFPYEESSLRRFENYRLPLLATDSELVTFDFSKGVAYRYLNADVNVLLQYSDILAYNPMTSDFLLAYGLTVDPHFLVINEAGLLGTEYEVIKLKRANTLPWWLLVLIIPFAVFVLLKRKSVPLVESLDRVTPQLRLVLSEEDFKIFQIIREQYPSGVEYPDLQSSFERELSYESRIKKLRNTIAHIDETAQAIIGKSSSIFDITKGKEDKRVKVIRVKDDEVFQYWWIKKASKNI
jgi:hypothetical protein